MIFTKNVKTLLLTLLSIFMAFCVFAGVGIAKANVETTTITMNVFKEDYSGLTMGADGRLDLEYSHKGVIGTADSTTYNDENSFFVNNDYTGGETALHFRKRYINYNFSPNQKIGMLEEDVTYNFSFKTAYSKILEDTGTATVWVKFVVYYDKADGSNVYCTADTRPVYLYTHALDTAQWKNFSLDFSYNLSDTGALTFTSTHVGDKMNGQTNFANEPMINNERDRVPITDAKRVTSVLFRIYSSDGSTAPHILLKDLQCNLSDVTVPTSLLTTYGADKPVATGELAPKGNLADATVGADNSGAQAVYFGDTNFYANPMTATNGRVSVVADGYSGSKALQMEEKNSYINVNLANMQPNVMYEFSYDVKLNAFNNVGMSQASISTQTVLYANTRDYFFTGRLDANANGEVDKTASTIVKANAAGDSWIKYFSANSNGDAAETFESMYKGENGYNGWATVKYRIGYTFNDGVLTFKSKRMITNATSNFITLSSNGDDVVEYALQYDQADYTYDISSIYRAILRIYCAEGSVLVDNVSIVECETPYTVAVTVTDTDGAPIEGAQLSVSKKTDTWTTNAQGVAYVNLGYADVISVKRNGYIVSSVSVVPSTTEATLELKTAPNILDLADYGNIAPFGDFENPDSITDNPATTSFDVAFGAGKSGIVSQSTESAIGNHSLKVDLEGKGSNRIAFRPDTYYIETGVKYVISGYMKTNPGKTAKVQSILTPLYQSYNESLGGVYLDGQLDFVGMGINQIIGDTWEHFSYWFQFDLVDVDDPMLGYYGIEVDPVTFDLGNGPQTLDKILVVSTSLVNNDMGIARYASTPFYKFDNIEPSFIVYNEVVYFDGITIMPEYELKANIGITEEEADENVKVTITDYNGDTTIVRNPQLGNDGLYNIGKVVGPVEVSVKVGSKDLGTQTAYQTRSEKQTTLSFMPDSFGSKITVVDPSGNKLDGASVTCAGVTYTKDGNGDFVATGLNPNQTYQVTISAEGYGTKTVTITVSNNNETVTLGSPDGPADDKPNDKGGCGASVTVMPIAISLATLGLALVLLRRKKSI